LLLLLPLNASATLPLPDYRIELVAGEAHLLEQLNAAGQYERAINRAEAFQTRVLPAGAVAYELAFAHRALGDIRASRRALEAAVALDASLPYAWYDLGEVALLSGDLQLAERAFAEATRLRPDHWAGLFRLAELAANDGDIQRFDALLTKAVANGFDLRTVSNDAQWKAWYADPVLGEPLRRLLTVYWRDEVRRAFESPTP
jgi:tetratricopeptide (TPR) repeat protein